jgi:hypothetical protein
MPRVWMAIPIGGTAPLVAPYRERPEELEQLVRGVVETEEGAHLEALYFDVDRPVAYALVRELDNFIGIRAVFRALGVEEAVKVLDVQQATDAIGRERALVERFSSGSGESGQ